MEKLLAIREETVKNLRADDDRINKLELLDTIKQIDHELGSRALFVANAEDYAIPEPKATYENDFTPVQLERLF